MKKIIPAIGIIIFVAALSVLHRELAHITLAQIRSALAAIPDKSLLFACLAVFVNYAVLTLNDTIAVRHIGAQVPYRHVALVSFISNAVGFNVGMNLLSGGSVRYRLYSAHGLSPVQVAQVVVLCHITLTLGLWASSGAVMLAEPLGFFAKMGWSLAIPRVVGVLCLAIPVAIFAASRIVKSGRCDGFLHRFIPDPVLSAVPGWRTLASQLAVGVADPIIASLVLYCFLPDGGPGVVALYGVYIVAMTVGAVSQVPGGLGVFEITVLFLLTPFYGRGALLSALLLYRIAYYIVPLVLASFLLLCFELSGKLGKYAKALAGLLPGALSLWAFFSGTALVFTGTIPPLHGRMKALSTFVSLPVLEVSHFANSIAGTVLLFLAWGLARRLRSAWVASIAVTGAATVLSLTGGLHYEPAAFTLLLLVILLFCRKSFYRLSFFSTFDPKWVLMIAAVLGTAIWLGFFAYRHVEYSDQLWWRFAFTAGAPRFLRAALGMSVAYITLCLFFWLRPSPIANAALPEADIEVLVSSSRNSGAALALLGDKKFFTLPGREAAIMYASAGGFWVSMGDPIGGAAYAGDLIWQFCEAADRRGAKPVFYEAGEEWIDVYHDAGLQTATIGEEAYVDLRAMSPALEGGKWRGLRSVRHHVEEAGCSFRVVDDDAERDAMMPRLHEISDAWLAEKHGTEKGFSLGFFDEAYLRHFPVAVVEETAKTTEGAPAGASKIFAFCNLWTATAPDEAHGTREISVDLMRYAPDSPDSIMSYLFLEAMLWGKAAGYSHFCLGMAPLSNMKPEESLWEKAGAFIYKHGEGLYNFQGVRHYKEKFHPEWHPRYLVYPNAAALPLLLPQLVRLIS